MVDRLNNGQIASPQEEVGQDLGRENGTSDESNDIQHFLEMWQEIGQLLIEDTDPAELSDFLNALDEAQDGQVDFVIYFSEDNNDNLSLNYEFSIEDEDESDEPENVTIDDLDSIADGDSDESN